MSGAPVFDTASFARSVRAEADGSGWIAREGTLSRIHDGIAQHVYEFAGSLWFLAKPAVWDHVFWKIMQISFKRKPSPTRHFWGMNCKTPAISQHRLTGANADDCAKEVLPFVERSVDVLAQPPLTLQMLNDRALPHERAADYVATEVVDLYAKGQHAAARAVCEAVLKGDRPCSHTYTSIVDGRSVPFFELARDWTEKV